MASATRVMKARIRMKAKKAGRARKRATEKQGSTPAKAVFFSDQKPAE